MNSTLRTFSFSFILTASLISFAGTHSTDLSDQLLDSLIYSTGQTDEQRVAEMEALIEAGADVNAIGCGIFPASNCPADRTGGYSVLMTAANGSADQRPYTILLVKMLLKRGANVNYRTGENGWSPLSIAISSGGLDVIDLLIDARAQLSPNLFPHAIANNLENPVEVLQRLLMKFGKFVVLQDLLSDAIEKNNFKLVSFLIEKGVDIKKSSRDGGVFHSLAYSRLNESKLPLAELLLKQGAQINLKDSRGQTANDMAVVDGQRDLVEFFIAHGADVNSIDVAGRSAIIQLAEKFERVSRGTDLFAPFIETAKLLINAGADSTVKDVDGKTATDYFDITIKNHGATTAAGQAAIQIKNVIAAGPFGPSVCEDPEILRLVQSYFDAVDRNRTSFAEALKKTIVAKGCGDLLN